MAQVSWFLTGEYRPYDRKAGIHNRMPIRDEFFLVRSGRGKRGGVGAWEIAARFSSIVIDDENVRGNNMTDFTAGLNWYLNPYARVKVNYIRAFLEDTRVGNSMTDAFGLRLDTEF